MWYVGWVGFAHGPIEGKKKCSLSLLEIRSGARIFCLGGPNFVTNILVSSQDKPSHSGINAHT